MNCETKDHSSTNRRGWLTPLRLLRRRARPPWSIHRCCLPRSRPCKSGTHWASPMRFAPTRGKCISFCLPSWRAGDSGGSRGSFHGLLLTEIRITGQLQSSGGFPLSNTRAISKCCAHSWSLYLHSRSSDTSVPF